MTQPLQLLNGLTAEIFLSEYWQKKPLLIRQAIPDYECPIDANELAGLAMEEEVESRIVLEEYQGKPWQPLNGPFEVGDFNKLPETHWTLLVQQLDAWSPEINELKQLFDFIPYWRFDDIMASYAPEGGSVGPHYDQYDVFLLQASGKRHWRIGQMCDEHSPRREGTPLRILEQFEESDGWILEPGDMLYLPPDIAHYGIALGAEEGDGDCITLSIGYKAPSEMQIIDNFANHLLSKVNPSAMYNDPDLSLQDHASEITDATLAKIRSILNKHFENPEHLSSYFGEFVSAPKNDKILSQPEVALTEEELLSLLHEGDCLEKNEGSRFFYTMNTNRLKLFVDGARFDLDTTSLGFVKTLCSGSTFNLEDLSQALKTRTISNLLVLLVNQGSLYLDEA